MKDFIVKVEKATRMVFLDKVFIGVDGENLQKNLIFQFTDEFVDGIGRLEFEINDEKNYILLEKKENTYFVPIKSFLTKEGQISMQLVVTEEESEEGIPVFKSKTFNIYCSNSILAEIEQPDEYPDWIETANQNMIKMNKIIIEAEQMEREALQLDADVRELEKYVNSLDIDVNNLDIEVGQLSEDINLIANDIDTHTEEINALENNLNKLNEELLEQEQNINHLDDVKANAEDLDNYYTKEENDEKLKGYATTSSLILGINSCEPKMANTVDYVIETGMYGNGESGYRKYKNGMIEQWGVATTQASETEFTMHKPHIDQNFSIFVEPREIGNFYHYAIPSANQKFKCRIQSRDNQSMAIKFQWRSFGRWK